MLMPVGLDRLGMRLAILRRRRGWTKVQLSESAGVSASNLSRYESGKKIPQIDTLERILDALSVTFSDLEALDPDAPMAPQRPSAAPPGGSVPPNLEALAFIVGRQQSQIDNMRGEIAELRAQMDDRRLVSLIREAVRGTPPLSPAAQGT